MFPALTQGGLVIRYIGTSAGLLASNLKGNKKLESPQPPMSDMRAR